MKVELLLLSLFAIGLTQTIYPWTCSNSEISLTVNQPMVEVRCTCSTTKNGRIAPTLPAGLIYTRTTSGSLQTIVISGTPVVGLQKKTFTVGYQDYVSTFTLEIFSQPTSISYGFKEMNLFTTVPLEPIPISSNTAITSFTINPALPEGLLIDATSGTISGSVASTASTGTSYTVTATNSFGSTTTTFAFNIKDVSDMTMGGFVACYWAGITECLTPSFNYFYKNPAQYCQHENKIDFSDTWASEMGSVWPGLDYRFLDYFSAYMYGYFNIQTPGTYKFYFTSDDGALFYLDDLEAIFIDREGCRGKSTTQGTKTLTRGRHIFAIRFFEFNEAAVLAVEYENTEAGIAKTIADTNTLKVGGRGPTFISYPVVSGFTNADITTYQPTMSSGGATSWVITPALPSGLSIDATNGYITGRPVAVANSVHTVTASGYTGSGEATVRVVIAAQPVSGMYTKYYTITDSSFCSYKALSGNQIDLKVVKIDNNINHPAQNPVIPWTGLTADFTANFYVVWEGYLHHDAIGEWGLRISCDDGCKLLSTNNNELINHWHCNQGFTAKETARAISSVGYYYYKVEYQQSSGNGGMKLEWRRPGEGWTDVPSEKMFHAPTSVVSYEYEMAHYFVGVAIEENKPIFFGASGFSNFQVSPSLPAGLTINPSTGIITGSPSQEINIGEYTITCSNGGSTEKVVISMDVFYVLPPTGLTLKQNGLTATSVSLNAFTAMSPITVEKSDASVTVTSYSINPDLPDGLAINSSTGQISGTPTVSLETTTFVVSATNSGGSFFMTFSLTVSGCKGTTGGQPWTNSFYTLTLISGSSATFSLRSSSDSVIQCGTGSVSANGDAIMNTCSQSIIAGASITYCFKPNEAAKLHISCSDEDGCIYQLRREDGHYFPTLQAYDAVNFPPFIQSTDFPNTLTPLTAITVLPSAEMNVYNGYEMNTVTLTLDGAYKSISISPYLGGVSLTNPMVGGMTVYSGGAYKKEYTITASGDAGTATAVLTLNFVDCDEDNGAGVYTFEKTTTWYGGEDSYDILDSNDKVLLSVQCYLSNAVYTNVLCMTSGNYKIQMRDSYGDGWGIQSAPAYLRIKDPSGTLIKETTMEYTYSGGFKTKSDSFAVSIVETSKVQWRMKSGRVSRDWYAIDFDDSDWEVKNSGVIGNWDETTYYFRYTFELEDAFQYPLLQFSVYYKDGLVVYLNGAQVYLRNLPEKFNQNTQATGHYDDYYQRMGTAPGHQLRDGKNVVAIEMHKYATTSGELYWKAYVNPLQGTCISRVDAGTITESPAFNQATESAAAAWDRSTATNWIENSLPAWTTWSYNYDRVEWVNKVILGSALRYPESDPTEVNVYGSNDNTSWDLMKTIKQVGMFSGRGETKEFMMMDHLNAYGHYKIEITKSYNGAGRTGLSVIDLQSCQLTYCTDNNHVWPGTLAGLSVTIDCAEGYIGERTRVCGNERLKPQWLEADESECRSLNPPKKTVYIDFAISVTEVTVETMMNGGAEAIITVLGSNYPILLSEMEAWKVKDITDNTVEQPVTQTAVWVRITRASEGAGDILKAVTNGLNDIASNLKEFKSEYYPESCSFSFYLTPMLSERKNLSAVSITLIVILVIVVLVLACIIGFWIWVRTKSKKYKNGAKQLRAGYGSRVKAQHLQGKNDRV